MNSEWCGVLNGPREVLEQVWSQIERQPDVTGCGKLVSSAGAVGQPGEPFCAVAGGNLEPYDGDQLFLSGVESDGGFREWLRKLPGEWPGITGEFEAYHDSDLKSSYAVWRIDADGTVYAMRTDKPGLIDHVRELDDAVCRDIELTPDEVKVSNDRCAADKGPDNRGERAVRAAGI